MRVGSTENMTVTPPRVMALYFKPADSKSMIPWAGAAAAINRVRISARQRSTLPSYDAAQANGMPISDRYFLKYHTQKFWVPAPWR